MNGKISKWNNLRMEFFLEEVYSRFWNHKEGIMDLIMEIQYFPAIYCGDHSRRVFIGPGITLDFPYSQRKNDIRELLRERGEEVYREYERNYALGFVMTGSDSCKIGYISFAYHIKDSHQIFMENFGVGYKDRNGTIILWYNLTDEGKVDEYNIYPRSDSMIRVRFLKVNYFMKIMEDYISSGFQKFPYDFIKDDYQVGTKIYDN